MRSNRQWYDCNYGSVVDEMPDMIVLVNSCLVWDLVSEVENGVLLLWDFTIPALNLAEAIYMFLKSPTPRRTSSMPH